MLPSGNKTKFQMSLTKRLKTNTLKTKHNIIANSSFSWWGAFLNKNKEKIVIIPETGFYNEGWEHMKVNDNWIVIQE